MDLEQSGVLTYKMGKPANRQPEKRPTFTGIALYEDKGCPLKQVHVPEEAVMGAAYIDTPFDKTLNSVPVENPMR